jgi:two-component system chemotaxis response regulator CheY
LDSFSSLDSLKEKNKILWQFKSGRQKIFLISKKEIDDLQIFSLSDITRMEYDKQRNRYLLDYLFDILQRMRKRAIVYDKGEVKVEKLEEKSFVEPTYDQIRLDAMHGYERENALDYVNSLDETIFEEIAEMEELENDISLVVDEIEEHFSLDKINQYGLLLQKYSKIISSLIEFEDLAYSLAKISNFLETLHHRDFDERKLFIILLSIKEDLKYWRKNIFETKEAKDIHYLDASLLSSCLQIENEFINKSFQDDDTNDLELF